MFQAQGGAACDIGHAAATPQPPEADGSFCQAGHDSISIATNLPRNK
jgi:hypothetical protein